MDPVTPNQNPVDPNQPQPTAQPQAGSSQSLQPQITPQTTQVPVSPQQPASPQQTQVSNLPQATQQPVGFAPAGFDHAGFLPDTFAQTGSVPPEKKKGIFSNKIFITAITLIVFGLVIGGAFAYFKLWVVDRAPVLISYAKAEDMAARTRGRVMERISINISLTSDNYDEADETKRAEAIDALIDRTKDAVEEFKVAAKDFNAIRDPDFAKLNAEYASFIDRCMDYTVNINKDVSILGPKLVTARQAYKDLNDNNKGFGSLSKAEKLRVYDDAIASYQKASDDIKTVELTSNEAKRLRDAQVALIADFIDDIKAEKTKTERNLFSFPPIISTFNNDVSKASDNINTQFSSGVCWSNADDELGEIFDEFDFNEEEQGILKTLEVLE